MDHSIDDANARAVEIYSTPEYAKSYIAGGIQKAAEDPAHEQEKNRNWTAFFVKSLDGVDGKVLEVGSGGDGKFGAYLAETGRKVDFSDASPEFEKMMHEKGIDNATTLNVLTDEIPKGYAAFLAWRVLVHFSLGNIKTFLEKAYGSLDEGGRIIFNCFNRKDGAPAFQEVDFDGPYHMGVKRPYFYHTEEEVSKVAQEAGFKIRSFHKEGKEDKWLVYVLEKTARIDLFRKYYFFLSNFFPCTVTYNGITYKSSEAAFQAQKTLDESIRAEFAEYDAQTSKDTGRALDIRPDWDDVKLQIMYEICKAKFTQNPVLANKLIATEKFELVEGNDWNDTFWGVCNDIGENHLGKILMRIRQELIA